MVVKALWVNMIDTIMFALFLGCCYVVVRMF